jgi:hypothetical protein
MKARIGPMYEPPSQFFDGEGGVRGVFVVEAETSGAPLRQPRPLAKGPSRVNVLEVVNSGFHKDLLFEGVLPEVLIG